VSVNLQVYSVAVEFDTYEGRDLCDDPNGNHISIHTEGKSPNSSHHRSSLACITMVPVLNQGTCLICRIIYTENDVIVQLKEEKEASWITLIRHPIHLRELLQTSTVWVGFTASTGILHQQHEILDFFISTLQNKSERMESNCII
jgi:peptide-N4-(N-acetyl-beta-glucosaminyl)asparagine amidase